MDIQIFLVTDYIIEKENDGKFSPKGNESMICQAIAQANLKMRSQGMAVSKVRTQPVLNDGNKAVLSRAWKLDRIETPMLVFVDFAYGDEESFNVMSTLYGADMNATKIYETLEYFALLIRQNGKYIQPDGSEWKPLVEKQQKGAKEGNPTGGKFEVANWELPTPYVPILADAIQAVMNLVGEYGAKFLWLGAAFSAKQGLDAENQAAKTTYFALSGYLVFCAETAIRKK
ncbi:MAG: hypothetical protein RLZZ628_2023 [Bacteroidota bacterium]|jgi:hypothetical protein